MTVRPRAADDFAAIRAAIARITAEAEPRCPSSPERRLYDCLRSAAPCGVQCPHRDDWIGPEGDAPAALMAEAELIEGLHTQRVPAAG